MANGNEFGSQVYYNGYKPLESTTEVDNLEQLNNKNMVPPFVGKLVHVKSTHTIYVCAEVQTGHIGVWRPVFADDGTAMYLTSQTRDGEEPEVFKITAARETRGEGLGRLVVTYPIVITEDNQGA